MKVTLTTQLEIEEGQVVEELSHQDELSISAEVRKLTLLGIEKRKEQDAATTH